MTTYSRLLKSSNIGRKRVWLVSGKTSPLIYDAYEFINSYCTQELSGVDRHTFFGDTAKLSELREALLSTPFQSRAFVTLFHAERFKEWSTLASVLQEIPTKVFFVGIFESDDLPVNSSSFLALTAKSFTKQVSASTLDDESLRALILQRIDAPESVIASLIKDHNGDIEWLLSCLSRLSSLNRVITDQIYDAFVKDRGQLNFSECILRYKKSEALQFASDFKVRPSDLVKLISLLRRAAIVNDIKHQIGYFSIKEITKRSGLTVSEVLSVKDFYSFYDKNTVQQIFPVFNRLYRQIEQGSKSSLLALILKW